MRKEVSVEGCNSVSCCSGLLKIDRDTEGKSINDEGCNSVCCIGTLAAAILDTKLYHTAEGCSRHRRETHNKSAAALKKRRVSHAATKD